MSWKERKRFFRFSNTKICMSDERLKKAEPNEEYEDDEIVILIEKANNIIDNSVCHENELFAGKKKYSFKMYTAAISVKLIILSGTSFNSISKIELQDFDIKAKTIKKICTNQKFIGD